MANFNEIKTRIALRTGDYAYWTTGKGKDIELIKGEVCVCTVSVSDNQAHTAPTVLFKVCNETGQKFADLQWTSALAADVYEWAKQASLANSTVGAGNAITKAEWDATLNGGKGGIKFTKETTFATKAELDAAIEAFGGDLSAITDNDHQYTFEEKNGKLVVNSTNYVNGKAGTTTQVAELDFVTPSELETVLAGYKTKQTKKNFAGATTKTVTNVSQNENGEVSVTYSDIPFTGISSISDCLEIKDEENDRQYRVKFNYDTNVFEEEAGNFKLKDDAYVKSVKASDDGLEINVTPTVATTGDVTIDIRHTTHAAGSAKTASTATIGDAYGATGTIKIPKIVTNAAGHVTEISEETVTVKMPVAQDLSGYKTKQTAVVDPTAAGNATAFIDSIAQNANGEITATKKSINFATLVPANETAITIAEEDTTTTADEIEVITNLTEGGTNGHAITATYVSVPTKAYVDKKASGAVDYLGTVGSSEDIDRVFTSSTQIGDFARASNKFTYTYGGDVTVEIHSGDLLIRDNNSGPFLFAVIHGEEGDITEVEAGTGLAGGGSVDKVTISLSQATQDNIAKGVEAHQWGNHANAGYAKDADLTKVINGTTVVAKATDAVNATNATKATDADKLGGQAPSHYATAQSVTDITKANGTIDSKISAYNTSKNFGDIITHNAGEFATSAQGAKADSAVQSVSLSTGSTNGTVKLTVDGVVGGDVAVKGLGSAAYTNSNAYATKAQGDKADTAVQSVDFKVESDGLTLTVDGTDKKVTFKAKDDNVQVVSAIEVKHDDASNAVVFDVKSATANQKGVLTLTEVKKQTNFSIDLHSSDLDDQGQPPADGRFSVMTGIEVSEGNATPYTETLHRVSKSGSIYDLEEASETNDGIQYIVLNCNW